MKRIAIFLIIFLLLAVPFTSFASGNEVKTKKDPIFAGALSWYVPGLGQIYSEAYLKGAIFWVVEESLMVGTVLTFANLKLDITRAFDLGMVIKSREAPDEKDKRTAILLGISLITVHFFNVVDAVSTALRYNRNLENYYFFNTDYDYSENRIEMSAGFKF